jgi:thiamine kinase-like enzyme
MEVDDRPLKSVLADIFGESEEAFSSFSPLTDGISNNSYKFLYGGSAYVLRITGGNVDEGQREKLKWERLTYTLLRETGIPCIDRLIHFNAEAGIKITAYISGARYPDMERNADVKRCVKLLKNIHNSGIFMARRFDIGECFAKEDALAKRRVKAYLPGYAAVRERAIALFDACSDVFPPVFCHIDPIKYNFLFGETRDYLIDFEYSGMASPMIDLAAFSVYQGYNPHRTKKLLGLYLGRTPLRSETRSLFRYLGIEGLYSVLWYLNRPNGNENTKKTIRLCYGRVLEYIAEGEALVPK